MRILRLNEMKDYELEREQEIEYGKALDECVDDDILFWIMRIAEHTNLKEYTKIIDNEFAKKKDIDTYLFKIDNIATKLEEDIEKLNDQLREVKKELQEETYVYGARVLYKFQEELLHSDFNTFYEYFIQEDEEYVDKIEDYEDIHPKIMEKYKDVIKTNLETRKYNL